MATTSPQPKPFHFFKIITHHNLHKGKLNIPNEFVEKYGEHLPNTLFLKTPNGAEWELNVERHAGKIWFQKGWKEFAEYHSLAHGYLLVFRCQRTSHFQVHICDLSALEIEYPSRTIEDKMISNNQGNKSPNDENLECQKAIQKRKHKSSVKFHQPHQLRRTECVKVENNLILQKETLHHADTTCKGKSKATALDRANSFKPCNPFFLVVVHPGYIGSRGLLNLPAEFCRIHFNLHKKQTLINLQVLNERVWPAKFLIEKHLAETKFRFSSGWMEFAKHYNLKVGDVCIFELIHRTKLTLLVHIFRDSDSSNCSTSQEKSMATSNQVTALGRASYFKSCNPFFSVMLRPSYLHRLSLPAAFVRKHFDLHRKQRLIILQELNGRVWPAKFLIHKGSELMNFRLSTGWKEYIQHNNLRVGDVCTFELIHTTKLTFLVHIFREPETANCSTSQESGEMRAAFQRHRIEMKSISATK